MYCLLSDLVVKIMYTLFKFLCLVASYSSSNKAVLEQSLENMMKCSVHKNPSTTRWVHAIGEGGQQLRLV